MPELPDVEIYRQDIERHALGRKVSRAEVLSDNDAEGHAPHDAARLAELVEA